MNTITHALLPVIVVSLCERVDRGVQRKRIFSTREILFVGIFGAAPDLLNPHLSLAARYTSWSHGLPFWIALTIALLIAFRFYRTRLPLRLVICFSVAYALHLICDLIAGGLAFWYPFAPLVLGQYWVPPQWWAWIDASCVLIVYVLWRIFPHIHRSQETKM